MAHPMGESTREGRRVEREPPNDRDRRENDGEHQPETTVALNEYRSSLGSAARS